MAEANNETSEEGSAAARERAATLIGRTISDRYKIIALLAMGGMGAVYRAQHLLMRKTVAIKVLHPETEGFPELVARFEREAVAGAHIAHPNVATASDFGKFDGESRFLVLELIRGCTLRELLETRGPLPSDRAANIVRQIAAALSAVHQKGIVHRDIKPRNIMIVDETRRTQRVSVDARTAEDVVKLIDFGLSKVPVNELSMLAQEADQGRRDLTEAGVVMGTVGYLAPEAALGMRSVLAPADLYSLGVVFYEMLCGKPPFEAEGKAKLFAQHCRSPVPPIAERNPAVKVPQEIEAIVRRLLEKEPDRRYPSADALIEALDAALASPAAGAAWRPVPAATVAAADAAPKKLAPPPSSAASGRLRLEVARMKGSGSRRAYWIVGLLVAVVGIVAIASRGGDPASSGDPAAASGQASAPSSQAAQSGSGTRPAPPRAPSVVDRLHAAVEAKDSARAVAVFLEIASSERAAFGDRAVQAEAADLAELAAPSGAAADPIFDRLANALGTDGLDILYDLAARESRTLDPLERTGLARPTGAGARARAILGRPDVLARATPAMRIAYEVRRAPCGHRPSLFARAAKEGDDRALQILMSMSPPACSRTDACCYDKHRELPRAIAEIQARLRH